MLFRSRTRAAPFPLPPASSLSPPRPAPASLPRRHPDRFRSPSPRRVVSSSLPSRCSERGSLDLARISGVVRCGSGPVAGRSHGKARAEWKSRGGRRWGKEQRGAQSGCRRRRMRSPKNSPTPQRRCLSFDHGLQRPENQGQLVSRGATYLYAAATTNIM